MTGALTPERRAQIEALMGSEARTHDQLDWVVEELLAEVDRLVDALAARDRCITQARVITTNNGKFRVRYRQHGQWERSGQFTTEAEAKTWIAARKQPKPGVAS